MKATERQSRKGFWVGTTTTLFVFVGATLSILESGCSRSKENGAAPAPSPVPSTTTPHLEQRIQLFCGNCHVLPPADTFPRAAWKDLVERMYLIFNDSGRPLQPPPIDEVVNYFEQRAPLQLPLADIRRADHPLPVRFERTDYPVFDGPPNVSPPHISNVNLVHLFHPKKLDVLACEMYGGALMLLQPYLPEPKWRVLYSPGPDKDFHPAHTEVVDLDRDGIPDILVANLGSSPPTDRRCGSVIWLRGLGDGRFEPITLFKNKGRIADVQAADFNGDGKLDLLVASFGWNTIGEIYYLENHTSDWRKPVFKDYMLDDRHGTIHVPIADLNSDGKPDFVALISQEHETIVAFLNDGKGHFDDKRTLFTAPHPGYGSSGIQLVDLNGDGKLDVLYTNGDVLDRPFLLKPYHSIQWLENKGDLKFEYHPLTPMYGVHRAVAADLDGDGDLDIVAVCFLPAENFDLNERHLDSVIVLEQTAPGVFARHTVETGACDHVTCIVGDVFGSGRLDIVTANFTSQPAKHAITIWKNLPPKK